MLNIYKLKKNNVKNDINIIKEGILVKEMRYNPAHSREWFNSVYTFNKNTVKLLPSKDIYVSKLIKYHFNTFSNNLEKRARLYSSRLTNKITKVNKIFVGKPEFKHTNDKVIITLYIYNPELMVYMKKMNKIRLLEKIGETKIRVINKKELRIIKKIYTTFLVKFSNLNTKYLSKINYSFFNIEKNSLLDLIKKMLVDIKLYLHTKKIIHLNKSKFNSIHIMRLRDLLRKVYGKNVEFNIVNLKNYSLNSSILNQILAIKLKEGKFRPEYLLNKVVKRIKLPYKRTVGIPYKDINNNKKKQNLILRNNFNNCIKKIPYIALPNKSKSLYESNINKLYIKKVKGDNLNTYLSYVYPKEYIVNLSKNREIFLKSRNLENTVLDSIKNKVINGIRLESKGKLFRRVSGRASFLMKQRGTIRNVYSSYRQVSSVLLRGNLNYNVDLGKLNCKGNYGIFGLKGWISTI